jgi:hypothetical protein
MDAGVEFLLELHYYDQGFKTQAPVSGPRPEGFPAADVVQMDTGLLHHRGDIAVCQRIVQHGPDIWSWLAVFIPASDRTYCERGNHAGVGIWVKNGIVTHPQQMVLDLHKLIRKWADKHNIDDLRRAASSPAPTLHQILKPLHHLSDVIKLSDRISSGTTHEDLQTTGTVADDLRLASGRLLSAMIGGAALACDVTVVVTSQPRVGQRSPSSVPTREHTVAGLLDRLADATRERVTALRESPKSTTVVPGGRQGPPHLSSGRRPNAVAPVRPLPGRPLSAPDSGRDLTTIDKGIKAIEERMLDQRRDVVDIKRATVEANQRLSGMHTAIEAAAVIAGMLLVAEAVFHLLPSLRKL